MPNKRMKHTAATVNGKIYVIGGVLNNESGPRITTGLVEAYDPVTDSWETKTSMPTPRSDPKIAVVDGKIYVLGGWYPSPTYNFYDSMMDEVEEYNPSTDSWNTKTPLPTKRRSPASGVVNGEIYVIGGSAYDLYSLNEKFNPLTDTWLLKSPMPVSGDCTSGIAINDKIYVIGAASPQTIYEYDPALDP
jgi:N-acetylneuraminic acid mutarotase